MIETGSAKREWNTCTSFYSTSGYFNNGVDQQLGFSNDPRQWAGGWLEWELEEDATGGCAELDGNDLTMGNVYMDLYELDLAADDFISWLTYPNHTLTLDCPDEDTCEGTSQWYSPSGAGNSEIFAKSRLIITGSYFESECIEQ